RSPVFGESPSAAPSTQPGGWTAPGNMARLVLVAGPHVQQEYVLSPERPHQISTADRLELVARRQVSVHAPLNVGTGASLLTGAAKATAAARPRWPTYSARTCRSFSRLPDCLSTAPASSTHLQRCGSRVPRRSRMPEAPFRKPRFCELPLRGHSCQ